MSLDHQRFITTWQRAKSLSAFLEDYPMNRRVASSMATYFRSRGVTLKRMPRKGGRPKSNYQQLAKLANKTLKKGA